MNGPDIVLERETANDESALVVAVHAASGSEVDVDAPLFDIENSKAVQEVRAQRAGILLHELKVGDEVQFGLTIARIVDVGGEDTPACARRVGGAPPVSPIPSPSLEMSGEPDGVALDSPTTPLAPRFSHAATALIRDRGLGCDAFSTGFVTSADVLAYLGERVRRAAPAVSPPPGVRLPHMAEVTGTSVSRSKSAEIDALANGAGSTMLSVLGATLGDLPLRREADDFLKGQITDLVIYESSRLLRKYAALNSFFADGRIVRHERVCAGLAMDRGGRLVVYGIEDADKMDLHGIRGAMSDGAARYMLDQLSAAELTRATFTVTDLSAAELDFVLPLLPRGQSLIVGVTRSAKAGFRLFAGFDHRVTEGRLVSEFLGELSRRVASFAAPDGSLAIEPRCGFCEVLLSDATRKHKTRGLLKVLDREGREALCCASCWDGW